MRSFRSDSIGGRARPVAATMLTIATLLIGAGGVAGGQQQDVYLELRQRTGRAVRLALPALQAFEGASAEAALLHQVLWDDLRYSMAFEMVDPSRYPDSAPGEAVPWDSWRRTPAEALIHGLVRRVDDRILAEFRLFDVASGQQVSGKRYTQDPARVRRIAHAFSDEAVLHYTGVRGVASTQIVFVSDRESPTGSFYKELFIADYDGFGQRRITYDNTLNLSPAFSPQGDRVAYVSYKRHGNLVNPDIYMAFKTGGTTRPVITCKGTNTAPAFSPDGLWLAASSSCSGNPELVRLRPDGGDLQRLTLNPASETSPTWSPNGRQIAFVSDRVGSPQLYMMDADGTNVRRLSTVTGQKDDPAWQPGSGDLIAFTASTGGNNFDIFVYDLTEGRTIQLTRGAGRKEAPAWSPDGRQLVFEFTRGGSTQIWVMGLDGSQQRMLTQIGNNLSPTWGVRP